MYSSKSLESDASVSSTSRSSTPDPSGPAPVLDRDALTALAAPFDLTTYLVRARSVDVRRTHAIADAYLPVHVVRRRLDEVLGPAGYREAYAVVGEGAVRCDLTVGPPSEGGVTRTGFGEAASLAGAQAEAFMAAAVAFGVGEQAAAVNPFHVRLEIEKEPDEAALEALRSPGGPGAGIARDA